MIPSEPTTRSTEHLNGVLRAEGREIGPCRLTLHRDPFALNDMRAEVFGLAGVPEASKAVVQDVSGRRSIEVTLDLALASWSFGAETVIRAPVTRIDERVTFEPVAPDHLTIDASFPLTSLTSNATPLHTSYLGTIRLTDFFDPRWSAATDAPFHIDMHYGRIEVGEAVRAYPGAEGPHASSLLVRRSYARFATNVDGEKGAGIAREQAELSFGDLFACCSLAENDRILPYATSEVAVGGGKLVSTRTVSRWTSPPSANYRPGPYPAAPRRETLQALVRAVQSLDPDARAAFDRMSRNLSVAATTPVLEFELIHWHSCLDVLIKRLGSKPKKGHTGFSPKLVSLCDRLGVGVDDLLDPASLVRIRVDGNDAPAFPFTTLRNNYIHDGFDAFEGRYDDATQYIRVLRALTERIFLHTIGVDYSETHLGMERV